MSERLLDPDLADVARHLTMACRLSAADEPLRYRTALNGRRQLADFFHRELGWNLEVHEVAGVVRLHKRREDVPADRGPYLVRADRQGTLAGTDVLVLVALICEQLWRRPRISLRELLQSIAQVCAAEAATGRLPSFRIVATDGVSKREAQAARQNIVDALKLLVAEGEIAVDSDLDRAVSDDDADLFITANRESLSTKFAALSPTLLALTSRPAVEHAAALSAPSLPDADPATIADRRSSVEGRRLTALRRLVDDPSADPDDDPSPVGYLSTLTGRERALNVAVSLGLVATVRRDWWEITDPSGAASGIDFPQGRRAERQAALAILAQLPHRPPGADVSVDDIVAWFTDVRAELPRWAASYSGRLTLLARAAAAELIAAGLLTATAEPDRWRPTPGVHLWRVTVRHGQPGKTADARRSQVSASTPASYLDLIDPPAANEDLQ